MAQIIDVIMNLTDNVTSGLDRIRSGMEQTARINQRLGGTLSNVGRNISSVGSALMPMASGLAAAGAVGVKTFMDFDATITAAGVKAGATREELNQMRDAAAKMGADFPITAREAAEGMDRLAAGGFNASQTIAAMPGIVEAAIASGEELATTSDVVTSALSIWNLTTGDVAANTTHVADVIQAAGNASKLGMADFGLAMQYAGAPAAALGINIEELGTAMGIMSNNGIEASTIGTSLRATLSRLADPPKAAAEALDRLGISTADLQKGDGSFIGLTGAVDVLRSHMQGLSDVQQVAALKAIAGEDAYSGLLALIKTSPEAYQQMQDTITNSSGSSHAAYLQMQDTLKGSIDALMSSVEAMGISFGSALAPTIRAAANELKFLSDTFTNLSPETKNLIIDIAGAVIGFTGLTLATGKAFSIAGTLMTVYGQVGQVMAGNAIRNKALEFAVKGVTQGFSLLRVGMAGLMGPMGLVVAAIAIAAVLIYRNWDKIGPLFTNLWNSIKSAFSSGLNLITPLLTRLQTAWSTLVNAFRSGTGIFGVLNILSNVLADIFGGVLYGAIILVSSAFTGVFTYAVTVVSTLISSAIGIFTGLIEFITGVFTGDWTLAWQGVVDIFSNIFGAITGIVDGILAGVKAAINSVIDGINSISVDIPEWVPDFGGQHFGGLNIPHLAGGTSNWLGGPVMINERGGEIVDLPSGTRVMPHDESVRNAYRMGASSARSSVINVNFNGVTITNTNDLDDLARKIAAKIHYEMEKEAINSTVGAI